MSFTLRDQARVLEHFTEHDIRAKNASDEVNEGEARQRLRHATVKATKILSSQGSAGGSADETHCQTIGEDIWQWLE